MHSFKSETKCIPNVYLVNPKEGQRGNKRERDKEEIKTPKVISIFFFSRRILKVPLPSQAAGKRSAKCFSSLKERLCSKNSETTLQIETPVPREVAHPGQVSEQTRAQGPTKWGEALLLSGQHPTSHQRRRAELQGLDP